jgi:hypothetical protein
LANADRSAAVARFVLRVHGVSAQRASAGDARSSTSPRSPIARSIAAATSGSGCAPRATRLQHRRRLARTRRTAASAAASAMPMSRSSSGPRVPLAARAIALADLAAARDVERCVRDNAPHFDGRRLLEPHEPEIDVAARASRRAPRAVRHRLFANEFPNGVEIEDVERAIVGQTRLRCDENSVLRR